MPARRRKVPGRPASRTAARYLARVGYGNRTPYHPAAANAAEAPEPRDDDLLFHLVVDHGDHDLEAPGLDPDADWPVRPDVQTSHRTGFEVRSYRRCWPRCACSGHSPSSVVRCWYAASRWAMRPRSRRRSRARS